MIYNRLTRYNGENREPDHSILIFLHALNKYEKHFGHKKLLELNMQYSAFIRNQQRELEDFNKLQFFELEEFNKLQFFRRLFDEKIFGEKIAAEQARIKKEIAFAIIWECLNEKMRSAFDQERWEKNWQTYFAELAKEVWNLLTAIEQERLRKELLSLAADAIHKQIEHLSNISSALRTWVECQRKIIYIQEEESANAMRNAIISLPKMPPVYEAKKQFIITEINNFIASKERSIPILLEKTAPVLNELRQHVLDPINEYGGVAEQGIFVSYREVDNLVDYNKIKITADSVEQVANAVEAVEANLIQKEARLHQEARKSKITLSEEVISVIYKNSLQAVKEQKESVSAILETFHATQDIDKRTIASYSSAAQRDILALQSEMSKAHDGVSKEIQPPLPKWKQKSSDYYEIDEDKPEEKSKNEISQPSDNKLK